MAAEEFSHPPPAPTILPPYPEVILTAIEALDDKNGSNKSAISKHIEDTYGELPPAHMTLLSHHLNKMKQSGQLVMVKNNYMKPDPNAPPRRGRGRPPKPKADLPPDAVVSPPRARGRPPKPRDPSAPPQTKSPSASSGRPRGRPPKKAKTGGGAPPATAASGTPRGRGRPPKVKTGVATPVGC
ncbi:unnamed protein product [Camellia sinensis]